jgi:hypothetical protein
VGMVCMHGIPLLGLFCNMPAPEQFVFYLLMLKILADQGCAVNDVYIDFACKVKVTWERWVLISVVQCFTWVQGSYHYLCCALKCHISAKVGVHAFFCRRGEVQTSTSHNKRCPLSFKATQHPGERLLHQLWQLESFTKAACCTKLLKMYLGTHTLIAFPEFL